MHGYGKAVGCEIFDNRPAQPFGPARHQGRSYDFVRHLAFIRNKGSQQMRPLNGKMPFAPMATLCRRIEMTAPTRILVV
ncbi:hypothetical protein [Mesorhizobium amorphae]|uniref:hypothetical protein n=1 Tax=Mesorhizobium amorphae TaxID=71433 RepID=UPI001642E69D|nr:hypothetical protein [Mesorhizobium amorphae]